MDEQARPQVQIGRRQLLAWGATAAVAALVLAPGTPAHAAVSPRLPSEIGRVNNQTTPLGGRKYDHVRVKISGDDTRLFIPQGVVPGSQNVRVLWLYHATGSSQDALIGGFKQIGERAVDLGMIAICQNLGGSLYTSAAAQQHQRNGWAYMSGLYGIDRNFLRATSHGGALATEVIAAGLIPNVVGAYIVNGVYDIENLYANGSAAQRDAAGAAFAHDPALIAAANPARHPAEAWTGKRVRLVYSQPDASDTIVPPPAHAKALIAAATPLAREASVRTHTSGHGSPSFADADAQETLVRWTAELDAPPPPTPPRLVGRWDFAETAAPFASAVAGVAALAQGAGSAAKRVATPFGAGVQLNGTTDYLTIDRTAVGALNVGATTGKVTVAAWVYSTDTNNAMIAGCWQDDERSYALFNDLPTYGGDDRVCMHVSKTGGITAGYPNCIDYSASARALTRGTWQLHVGTYDGAQAVSYLDGVAEAYPTYTDSKGATYSKNPYAFPAGLSAKPTDFLVGAVVRKGVKTNLHKGIIARLRVWDGALTPEAVQELYAAEKKELTPPAPPVPAPTAAWDFTEAAAPYASVVAGAPALVKGVGTAPTRVSTPFGGGVQFNGTTDFLVVPAANVGVLNMGATTNAVTIAAWVYSTDSNNACIAGCWQESKADPRRSYALFNDLPTYGGDDMVCMHVSKLGGATPGYPYSIDYSAEPRKLTRSKWQLHVGTYDGARAVSYLDGTATPYPAYTDTAGATYPKNPYAYPAGLNSAPVDFTVGAVVRDGARINLHKGMIAKLRVWNSALTAEQVLALFESERSAIA